jgi:hypothetical protein
MSKILKVSQGDYRLQVPIGNSITLDTGSTGSVVITGNLDIQGQTTTVESINTTVKDNIIILNNGESGTGITLGTAGIQLDRGHQSSELLSARFLFNEAVSHYNPLTSTTDNGTFTLTTTSNSTSSLASLQLNSVELSSISNNGTNTNGIAFNLRSTNTTLSVINSTYNTVPYESRLSDNSLTTKLYVNTYVVSGQMTPGMADVDKIYHKNGSVTAEILATSTDLEFSINTNQRAVINANGLWVDTLNAYGNTIKNTGANSLILTSDVNLVELNAVLGLDDQSSSPSLISGKTQIYSSATAGPGKSGLFFVNNTTSDELVAKNRALLFSMLF